MFSDIRYFSLKYFTNQGRISMSDSKERFWPPKDFLMTLNKQCNLILFSD